MSCAYTPTPMAKAPMREAMIVVDLILSEKCRSREIEMLVVGVSESGVGRKRWRWK
jgi:hypothetical protein